MPFKEDYSIGALNFLLVQIRFFLEPETKLKYFLDKNPFYPFTQVESYKFEYEYRLFVKFFQNLSFGIFSLLILIYLLEEIASSNFKFYILIWITALLIQFLVFRFFIKAFIFFQKRRLEIDLLNRSYSFFVCETLIIKNDLHQIYVRMIQKYVVKNQKIFCLILDGKRIDKLELSCFTNNEKFLRKMGKKLCFNLGLNYFDILNKSNNHQILNFCPLQESKDNLWDHLLNQNRIVIEKDVYYWKILLNKSSDSDKTNSNLSETSTTTELSSVKKNNSSFSTLNNNCNMDHAQEVVLTFNQLKNQLDMLSQQIKLIQNLKSE